VLYAIWNCNSHYERDSNKKSCELETKEVECTAPEHATVAEESVTVQWDPET